MREREKQGYIKREGKKLRLKTETQEKSSSNASARESYVLVYFCAPQSHAVLLNLNSVETLRASQILN